MESGVVRELGLLVVGKTGSGKSATSNTILGEEKFEVSKGATFHSLTEECNIKSGRYGFTSIKIMDTPGLFDTESAPEEVARKIGEGLASWTPGPDAIILVISGHVRFSREDYVAYTIVKKIFGEVVKNCSVVIFTGGDILEEENVSPDHFFTSDAPEQLRQILKECDNRYVVFNNNATKNTAQVHRLLDMVQEIKKEYGGCLYNLALQKQHLEMESEIQRLMLGEEKREAFHKADFKASKQTATKTHIGETPIMTRSRAISAASMWKTESSEIKDWGEREHLPLQTIRALEEQGFTSLNELRGSSAEDITECFQKTGQLPLEKCLALKEAIGRLSSGATTVRAASPFPDSISGLVKEPSRRQESLSFTGDVSEAVSGTNSGKTIIQIGSRVAELQVLPDTDIKDAEALVVKVKRDDDRQTDLRERQTKMDEEEFEEEMRMDEAALEEARRGEDRARQVTIALKAQLSEAEARGRKGKKDRMKLEQRVQQMQEEMRAAEERVKILKIKLKEEKTKRDRRLATISRRYEEDKKRLEEQVMTFVIQVEEVHRKLLESRNLDEQCLRNVIERLASQFNIRLLGTDCGLRFLLDAPVTQWVNVVEKQLEIQAVLSDLIPEDARQDVTWMEVTQCGPTAEDTDLRIGRTLSVPETEKQIDPSDEASYRRFACEKMTIRPHATYADRVMAFDPLTAVPRRTFCTNSQLMTQGDKNRPWITSLVVTDGGKIVMTDRINNKVKVMDSRTLTAAASLSLGVSPHGLAILYDKLLAVTSASDSVIHLIDVTARLRLVRSVKTNKRYYGVGCGGTDRTLIVSCCKRDDMLASVDIVSREGQLLRTAVNGSVLRDLHDPAYLCVVEGGVLISDRQSDCVYRVDLATGRVMSALAHPQLLSPHQVSADRSGNVYIASWGGHCVLVAEPGGRWRTLLRGEEHGDYGLYGTPECVAVTETGVMVGCSNSISSGGSLVMGFDLT